MPTNDQQPELPFFKLFVLTVETSSAYQICIHVDNQLCHYDLTHVHPVSDNEEEEGIPDILSFMSWQLPYWLPNNP